MNKIPTDKTSKTDKVDKINKTDEANKAGIKILSWSRRDLWVLVTFYYLFLFYGSLVPFNFIPIEGGFSEQLSNLLRSDWVVECRSDLAVNILLGIPAGFLVLGVLSSGRSFLYRLLLLVPTLIICALGAIAVEAMQIYLPGRNAAMMDVGAQLFGAIFGGAGWLFFGPALTAWSWKVYKQATDGEGTLYWLILYFVLLIVGALMPLDIVTSPQELYHKWKAGTFFLIPFSQFSHFSQNNPTPGLNWLALQQTLETGFAFLPMGIFTAWIAKKRSNRRQNGDPALKRGIDFLYSGPFAMIFWSLTFSCLITFINVFVASREVYSSNIIMGIGFAILGYLCFCWSVTETRARILSAFGLAIWLFVLSIYYWYPFAFDFRHFDLSPLYSSRYLIPLADYQLSNPICAIDRLFSRFGNSLILSIIVCLTFSRQTCQTRNWAPILFCFILFALLESGQLFAVGRTFTLSDIIVQTIIAGVGCRIYLFILNIQRDRNKSPSGEK